MAYELIGSFLSSSGLQSLVGAIQVIAVAFVLRGLTRLELQGASLKRMIEGQVALHDVPDPKHHGAKLWWGVGINEIEEQLSVVTERQRVMGDRQRDFVEAIRELKKGQQELTLVCTKAVSQMAQREHLIG